MNSSYDSDKCVFTGELNNAKVFLNLLQSIDFNNSVIVIISDNGIKFSVEKNKTTQLSAFLQKELFTNFLIKETNITFILNIKHLIDTLSAVLGCLNIKENQNNHALEPNLISIKLFYEGYGHPFILELKNDIFCTICSEMTQDPDNMIFFELSKDDCEAKVIIQSDFLKEIWNEFDNSSDLLKITLDSEFGLIFSTCSQYATTKIKLSKNSNKISKFELIEGKTISYHYSINLLKISLKALSQSHKTCLKISKNGLLNIEYMIILENNVRCFVEYFCLPNLDCSLV